MTRRSNRGVTLLELLITVVIVGVLAAISYPSYTNYVRRTNRTDATAALLKVASAQEKFFVQNNTYATTAQITTLALNNSERGWYSIAITTTNGLTTDYTATATAVSTGRQYVDTDCRTFTVTSTGERGAKKADNTVNTTTCWR